MKFPCLSLSLLLVLLTGCHTPLPPIRTMPKVDIQRFMGPWYVVANIPTWVEEGAHNAVESYRLDKDGSIATTFTFREGSFEGPERRYEPRGFIVDGVSNAIWEMQFFWPIRSDYRIVYLSEDYSETIIGREARDFVWIMARQPVLSEDRMNALITLAAREGYNPLKIQRVPQQWKAP